MEGENRTIEQIKKLKSYLPDKTQEELDDILAYGEKMKKKGEKKKESFWNSHDIEDFYNLLMYKGKYGKLLKWKYKYLGSMEEMERKRFIEEYLHDYMLYNLNFRKSLQKKIFKNVSHKYSYEDLRKGRVFVNKWIVLDFLDSNNPIGAKGAEAIAEKVGLKEGVELLLSHCQIGVEGAKKIAKMKLKRCVTLKLDGNKIGAEGAKAIAENMKLQEGVVLSLCNNEIGDKGIVIMAENIRLKEGVKIYLWRNKIGPEGVKAIVENMEMKDGVCFDLSHNKIGDEGAMLLSKMNLKDGMDLDLANNGIGAEGAKAIAENLELKEGVNLGLASNEIGDEGAEAIMKNMVLKCGTNLDLRYNKISEEMGQSLKEREKSYCDRGIMCQVFI